MRRDSCTSSKIFGLTLALLILVPGPALSVSFRPDGLERAKKNGTIKELLEIEQRKKVLGVDRIDEKFALNMRRYPSSMTVRRDIAIILVDFSDVLRDTVRFSQAHFESLLFSKGVYPTGSLRDYYLENSYERFDMGGKIVGWFRMPQPYSYYSHLPDHGLGSPPANAQRLARDAILAADPYVNFALFDNDGPDGIPDSGDDDGFVDAVFVVHAGQGYEDSFDDKDIVSHQWQLTSDLNLDFVNLRTYAMVSHSARIGVFAHELGHVFGLLDLYDTTYRSLGLGYWSLMAWGSWTGYPRGASPVGLDAYSKARLGFVNPLVLKKNTKGVSISPIEGAPSMFRLWTSGSQGSEYFLVENRRRVGVDSNVPGEGLLIYHVDERIPNNDDPSHYRVAIEQADGEFDLEKDCDSDPTCNTGDAGDPFPGESGNARFGPETTPSSRAYGGAEAKVEVENIYQAGETVKADLSVERPLVPEVSRYFLSDSALTGSPNGYLEPGETGKLRLEIMNEGYDISSLIINVFENDENVVVEKDSLYLGSLPAGASTVTEEEITFAFSENAPQGTYGIWFTLRFFDGSSLLGEDSVLVAAGRPVGLSEDFESQGESWQHGAVSGTVDEWNLSTLRASSGGRSWKCGGVEGSAPYSSNQDAFLVSPLLNLNPGSTLTFKYWIEAETLTSVLAADGALVEVSQGGNAFRPLEPAGGYPFNIFSGTGDAQINGRGVFSGSSTKESPTGWLDAGFDLGGLSGSTQIRFRFYSDGSGGLEGWYIDDLRVETPLPAGIVIQSSSCGKEGIWLVWRSQNRHVSFDVVRCPSPAQEKKEELNSAPIFEGSDGLFRFLDRRPDGSRPWYLLRGITKEGTSELFGPWSFACARKEFENIVFDRNPFHGELRILLERGATSLGESPPVEVFDVAGRLIKRLKETSPGLWLWDGKDERARSVSSGIYFFRLKLGSKAVIKKGVFLK